MQESSSMGSQDITQSLAPAASGAGAQSAPGARATAPSASAPATSAQAFTHMSCEDFSRVLAARTSTPGGGSAAGLVACVGVCLAQMAAQFSQGKKSAHGHDAELLRYIEEAESLRVRFLNLCDADAHALKLLMQTFALPKTDPTRVTALKRALVRAYESPYQLLCALCQAIRLFEKLEDIATPMLLSDCASGILFCRAALEAACYNVVVNTRLLPDNEKAQADAKYCLRAREEYVSRAEACAERIRLYLLDTNA